jgi:hypothetical protein
VSTPDDPQDPLGKITPNAANLNSEQAFRLDGMHTTLDTAIYLEWRYLLLPRSYSLCSFLCSKLLAMPAFIGLEMI